MLGRGLAVAAAVAAVDQFAKHAVLRSFDTAGCGVGHKTVTPFFDLVLTCNRGVSFGLFNGAAGVRGMILAVVAAAIVLVLLYWLARVTNGWMAAAIGLIIGGAVGNVVDRLLLGGVVDFLDFHIGAWHWPAFNIADSAICVGVAMMLLESLLTRRAAPREERRGDLPP
ncbi:MAG TPA: signal peptidase II [Stellaceae bacterium]|nr:signal peptidase II [Stellaceae bacterium]